MNQRIILQPSEVWDHCQANQEDLVSNMHEIASYTEYGIVIYLSVNERALPCITVEADDTEIYSECVVDATDCYKAVQTIYEEYLTSKVFEVISKLDEERDFTAFDEEYAISERETELDTAVWEFLEVVFGEQYVELDDMSEITEDVKEHILEYIAMNHHLHIYRPMILEDENGEDFYEEYPYECMV